MEKNQREKKVTIPKQKQVVKRKLSKTRNAVSETDATTKQELQDLKDSIDKNNPTTTKNIFLNQESTTPSSIKGKCKKNSYLLEPVRLYNLNQSI